MAASVMLIATDPIEVLADSTVASIPPLRLCCCGCIAVPLGCLGRLCSSRLMRARLRRDRGPA